MSSSLKRSLVRCSKGWRSGSWRLRNSGIACSGGESGGESGCESGCGSGSLPFRSWR